MALKILQINIKSLVHNKNLIELYLKNENIDVAILSEVWLPENHQIKFLSFPYKKKTIRRKIPEYQLPECDHMEAAEMEIVNTICKLRLVTFYLPEANATTTKTSIKNLIDRYSNTDNVIIAGDVNAHHPMWNLTGKTNPRGCTVAEVICDSDLFILNTGEHTFRQNYITTDNMNRL